MYFKNTVAFNKLHRNHLKFHINIYFKLTHSQYDDKNATKTIVDDLFYRIV